MKIKEIMTTEVECVSPDTTLKELADKMKNMDVGFFPICENDRLIGAATDRDIVIRGVAEGLDNESSVREVMSTEIYYAYEDENVEEVARKMQDRDVRRLLILNRDKRLAGVVSIGDLSQAKGKEKLVGETTRDITRAA